MTTLSDLLNHHRSIRQYRPDAIDPALIEAACLEAVAGGASSGNLNSVSIVLTREPERRRRLHALRMEQDMILQAPLVMAFCTDWFRTRQWPAQRGARDNFNNLLGWHVALIDAIIVAQNVVLGLEARGLGTCYMGTTLHAMGELADFLDLPDTCLPVTSLVVGWPAEDPPRRDRLPLAALVHDERYRAPTPAEIDATFASREVRGWERYMSMPALKAAIEREGITSLAQYYTSRIKYAPETFQRDSQRLAAWLAERSFLP